MGYIKVFNAHFQSHHHHEEDIVFPSVSPKIPIDTFVEEHQQLDKLLRNLSDYTTKVDKKDVSYESAKIIELIKQISDLIRPHLKKEEDTFTVQALRENFTIEELNKITDKIDEEVKKDGVTTGLPFVLLHLPPEDRAFMIYSKMPWLVKKAFVPVFVKWNKSYWKYAKYQSL
jgi:hemerythrin-like domain-containing protein